MVGRRRTRSSSSKQTPLRTRIPRKAKNTNVWSDESSSDDEEIVKAASKNDESDHDSDNEDDDDYVQEGNSNKNDVDSSDSENEGKKSKPNRRSKTGDDDEAEDSWDESEPPEENTLRVLIATDNHLGFLEDDTVRGKDSFRAVEEIMQKALKSHADMVVFGGDLFHHNKPSRRTMHETLKIFRKYCLGGGPVSIEILSDQSVNFSRSLNKQVNYEDPNLAVQLPVFMIHGNHDDPTRDGANEALSAIDLLQDAGLVNYFGSIDELGNAKVTPILIGKGTARLALYGLGWVRDERLSRMFASQKIKFEKTSLGNDDPEFFNMFMVHQNRQGKGRGPKNSFHESFVPPFMHLVCFGHEHECRVELEESITGSYVMCQPGSSVATSLIPGEEEPKHVLLLEVANIDNEPKYRTKKLRLSTVRPFITEEVTLSRVPSLDVDAADSEKAEAVTEFLAEKVKILIEDAKKSYAESNPNLSARERKAMLPLVRLKVEYTGFSPINMQRFGARFTDTVANPGELLSFFKKRVVVAKQKTDGVRNADNEAENETGMEDDEVEETVSSRISGIIKEILEQPEKKLRLFDDTSLNQALDDFVTKEQSSSIREFVSSAIDDMKRTLRREKGKLSAADFEEKVKEINEKQKKAEAKHKEIGRNPNEDEKENESDYMPESNKRKNAEKPSKPPKRKASLPTRTNPSRGKRKASQSYKETDVCSSDSDAPVAKPHPKMPLKATKTKSNITSFFRQQEAAESLDDLSEENEPAVPVKKTVNRKNVRKKRTRTPRIKPVTRTNVINVDNDSGSDASVQCSIVRSQHKRTKRR